MQSSDQFAVQANTDEFACRVTLLECLLSLDWCETCNEFRFSWTGPIISFRSVYWRVMECRRKLFFLELEIFEGTILQRLKEWDPLEQSRRQLRDHLMSGGCSLLEVLCVLDSCQHVLREYFEEFGIDTLHGLSCRNSTANRNERSRHHSKQRKRSQSLRLLNTASSRKLGVIVAEACPSVRKQCLFAGKGSAGYFKRSRSHEQVQDRWLGQVS